MVHFTVVSQLGSSASDSPFFGVACSAWSSSAANALSFFVEVAVGTDSLMLGSAAWIAIGTECVSRPLLGYHSCAGSRLLATLADVA
jgi:hypothetical protein